MFKKISTTRFIVTFSLLFTLVFIIQSTATAAQFFNKNNLSNGLININYKVSQNIKTKVLVSKDNNRYFYNLLDSKESFPLQFGNGEYTVSILENTKDNKYVRVAKETFSLNLDNENNVYLNSNQIINWDENMDAIKLAKQLTQDANNDEEKVSLIYNYIVTNIDYDNEKINTLASNYVPNIDDTLKSSEGICYDYSALFASMLRSVDIPTKLVKGYKNDMDSYHAWNQVFLTDEGKWVTIDTTTDAYLFKNNIDTSLIKNENEYTIEKIY